MKFSEEDDRLVNFTEQMIKGMQQLGWTAESKLKEHYDEYAYKGNIDLNSLAPPEKEYFEDNMLGHLLYSFTQFCREKKSLD